MIDSWRPKRCARHPYRLNWFVLGLTAALAQGSLILLLLILAPRR